MKIFGYLGVSVFDSSEYWDGSPDSQCGNLFLYQYISYISEKSIKKCTNFSLIRDHFVVLAKADL